MINNTDNYRCLKFINQIRSTRNRLVWYLVESFQLQSIGVIMDYFNQFKYTETKN